MNWTIVLIAGAVALVVAGTHALSVERDVRGQYGHVLCHLRKCHEGANALAVSIALGIPPLVAFETLEKLRTDGYAEFRDGKSIDDPGFERFHFITPAGLSWIEAHKWQLHQRGVYLG